MSTLRSLLIVLALLSGCQPASKPSPDARPVLLNRDDGLTISRRAAAAKGYDLTRYTLDTFGKVISEDGKEWVFVYLCSPGPPPPGCSFMVVVDRQTGSTEVYPGE